MMQDLSNTYVIANDVESYKVNLPVSRDSFRELPIWFCLYFLIS